LIGVALTCLLVISAASHAGTLPIEPIAGLVNTGRNQSTGAADSNWTIVETGTQPVVVSWGYGLANNADSKWVWQQANGQPGSVTRTFRATFVLTAERVATARIMGRWSTDNFGDDIRINGVSTGQTSPGFGDWTSFAVLSGFVEGTNTLDFVVRDVGAPSAFRAELSGFTGDLGAFVNTGQNQTVGLGDPNWIILETGLPARVVSTSPPLPNSVDSKWIWQEANGQPGSVTRTFRTRFVLTAEQAVSARIIGRWATDNFGDNIRINGVATGQTSPGATAWSSFAVTAGFVEGVNTLDFVVRDTGAPGAFRAEVTGYDPVVITDAISREVAFSVDSLGQLSGPGGNAWVRDAVSREVAFRVDASGQFSGPSGNALVRDAVSREAAFLMVPPPCSSQSLSPLVASIGFRGGTGQCTLATGGAYCAWSVASEASWITVTSPASGNGTGTTVAYAVSENASLAPRSAAILAGASSHVVTQAAASDCNSNGIGDPADIDAGLLPDCDGNRIADGCDIASGGAADLDGNGVPDSCQTRDLVVEWAGTPPSNILPNLPTVISYRVRNVGNGPVSATWVEAIRLSADAAIGSDTDVAAFARVNEVIMPGAFVERSDTIIVPVGLVGTRRLVVALDTTNQVAEGTSGEDNNVALHPSPIVVDACNATNLFVAACEAATLNIPVAPGDGANVEIFNGVGGGPAPTAAQIASRVPSGVMLTPYVDYPNPGQTVQVGQSLATFFASTTVPPAQVASIAASNFILRITALVRIEREMDRDPATPQIDVSFGVGSDDGFHLTIGSTFIGQAGDRSFGYSWMDVDFEEEGLYPVTLLFAANSASRSGLEFAWNTALAGQQLVPQSAMYLVASECDRKVEFEDLAVGTVVTDQYAGLGLKTRVLGGNVQVTNAFPNKFVPVSGTRVLADPGANPSATGTVEFTFVVPGTESAATVDRFSLFVIDAETTGSLVQAFDSYGNEVFSEQVNTGGGTQTPVTIEQIGISRVVVTLGSGSDTSAIDNICFDRPTLDCYRNDITPSAASFSFGGGSGAAVVSTAGVTCPWTVSANVPWITFPSGSSGSGAIGNFSYAVAANPDVAPRTGTISAQDSTLVVTQAGAPDCNGNGIGDPSEVAAGTAPDCNGNGIPDSCEIASGAASDADANGVPDTCQYADLVLVSVETVPSSPTATQPFELRWTVRNAGDWPVSGVRTDRFLLSADAEIGNDVLFVEASRDETLAPGTEATFSATTSVPLTHVGARRIVAVLDATDAVRETAAGNANNTSIAATATTFVPPALPDLAVDLISSPASVQATVPFVVQYRVRNLGPAPTAVPYLEDVLVSADGAIGSDVLVKQTLQTATVPAGAEIVRTASVVVPLAQTGMRQLVVRLDAGNAITEFPIDDVNNAAISAIPIEVATPPQPNLRVAIDETPAAGAPGALRTVRWTTTNAGTAATSGSWVERVYASPDSQVGGDTLLGEFGFSIPIAAGASASRTREVQVPPIAAGYRIVVFADAALQMVEETESDNTAIATAVSEVLLPDLAVTSVAAPTEATADSSMSVSWTVRNDGAASAGGSWNDAVFLSADDAIGPGDRLVASRVRTGPVPVGVTYSANASFTVPSDVAGPMRVLVQTDVAGSLLEPPSGDTAAANSRAAANMTEIAQPERPDLVVASAVLPPAGLIGAPLSIQYTVNNEGGSAATGSWTDRLIARNVSTQAETHLGDVVVGASVAGNGGTYTRSFAGAHPLAEGTYRLVVIADHSGTVLEDLIDGETNNAWTSTASWTVGTFTVTAQTDFVEGPIPQTVTVGGRATLGASGDPVGGVPVRVRIGVRGTERQLAATTDSDGSYSVDFNALPNEAGIYTVRAGPVGAQGGPVQDTFTLFASRLDGPSGWQTIYPGLGQVTGALTLRNLGDAPLSGLALEVGSAGQGISLNIALSGSTLGPLETASIPFTAIAAADATGNREIPVTVRATQGTVSTAVLRFAVTPAQPTLVLAPGALSGTMVIPVTEGDRTQAFYACTVRNTGAGTAQNVRVVLPGGVGPWMNVVGGSQIGNLAPGAESSFVLQVSPPPGLAFGPYSGVVGVVADNGAQQLPFTFQAISAATGTLVIETADERTYYQTENPPFPPLAGAYVEVWDAYTGRLVASGTTQASGRLEFTDLAESYYRVRAIATDHGDFEGTTLVRPGQATVVAAYLPEQFVNYNWTVQPTSIDDEYDITIDLQFETNVPFPVVTVDPPFVDIQEILNGQQFGQVIYTLRNHGLVDAENVTFAVGTHPRYRLTPLITDIGVLNGVPAGTPADACVPGACIQIPVIVEDLAFEGGVADLSCFQIDLVTRYAKVCGIERVYQAYALVWVPGCPIPTPPPPPPPPPPQQGCVDCPPWEPPISQGPPLIALNLECEQCCDETSHEDPESYDFSFDSIGEIIAGIVKTATANRIDPEVDVKVEWTNDYCCERVQEGCVRYKAGKIETSAEISIDALLAGIAFEFKPNLPLQFDVGDGELVSVNINPQISGMFGISVEGGGEASLSRSFGCDENGCLEGSGSVFASGTAGGQLDVEAVEVEIPEFDGTTLVECSAEATLNVRLELGLAYDCGKGWQWTVCWDGIYAIVNIEASALGREFSFCRDVFIAPPYSRPGGFCEAPGCDERNGGGSFAGGEDIEAAIQASLDQMVIEFDEREAEIEQIVNEQDETPPETGLCASVAVQLSQEIAIARSAFEAELELSNSSATGSLDAVEVDLFVRDVAGNRADGKFFLAGPVVTGIDGVDGTDSLPGGQACSARWTLIPSDLAAASGPTQYLVSGTLSYVRGDSVTTVPLFPVPILVMPNPSLHLKYFIEETVYADDPFTPEIEPSIPFDLGLLLRNEGSGEATNVRMLSSQPRIVDNATNLLIDFQLIGTRIGLQPITPTLAVALGNIPPGGAQTVRWVMLSSLQGRFVDYAATIESRNGFGDPSLSLIDSVSIHALTHAVRDVGAGADMLPDFLVDQIPDALDLADELHRSDGPVEAITAVTSGSVVLNPGKREATLQVAMPAGWTYIRIDDPYENAYRVASVRRDDGTQLLMGENVWQTSRIDRPLNGPPVFLRHLHIFDRGGGEGCYVIRYEPDGVAPRVVSWASYAQHGTDLVPLRFGTPKLASEPRSGGCGELFVSFDEPVRRSTLSNAAVVVTAYDESGSEVAVGSEPSVVLSVGERDARITFDPPLANGRRYCIRLIGVTDLAGNLLTGATSRFDLAVVRGDLSGDARVTVNDAGAIANLLDVPFNPADALHVRADVDRNGLLEMADLIAIVGEIGRDLRTLGVNPCATGEIRDGDGELLAGSDIDDATWARLWSLLSNEAVVGGDRRGFWRPGSGQAAREPFILEIDRAAETVTRGFVRLDLLVVSGASEEAIRAAAEEFGLELSARIGDGPLASASVLALPSVYATPEALQSLAFLLEGQSLTCSAIVEDADGGLFAIHPGVSARLSASLSPEALVSLFGALPCVGSLDSGDFSRVSWTCPAWGLDAITDLMRRLATAPDVREVWLDLVSIGDAWAESESDGEGVESVDQLEVRP
jgi:hypothetical protein